MLSRELVEAAVKATIEEAENLGERAGGSGHLSFVSYVIDEIKDPIEKTVDGRRVWEVSFNYTTIVETEFTYYPDNPPYEYPHSATILIDQEGTRIR